MKKAGLAYLMLVERMGMSAFLVLQLLTLLIVENLLIASYNNRFMLYSPYQSLLSEKGYFAYSLTDEAIPETLSNEKINEKYLVRKLLLSHKSVQITAIIIPDKLYEKLELPLQSGSYREDDIPFPAVMVPNTDGIRQGDEIHVYGNASLTICGTLTTPTYIPSFGTCHADLTFADWYKSVSAETTDGVVLIAGASVLDTLSDKDTAKLVISSDRGCIITVSERLLSDEFEGLTSELEKSYWLTPLSEIQEKSTAELSRQAKKYIPIGLITFFVICMGITGGIGIFTLTNLRKYSVYLLCGAKKRDILKICAIAVLLLLLLSGIFFGVLLCIAQLSGAAVYFGFVFKANNLVISLLTIAVIYILSCGFSFAAASRGATAKLLREEKT